jgi:hypothetical protein
VEALGATLHFDRTEGLICLTRREGIVIGHAAIKKTLNAVQELLY